MPGCRSLRCCWQVPWYSGLRQGRPPTSPLMPSPWSPRDASCSRQKPGLRPTQNFGQRRTSTRPTGLRCITPLWRPNAVVCSRTHAQPTWTCWLPTAAIWMWSTGWPRPNALSRISQKPRSCTSATCVTRRGQKDESWSTKPRLRCSRCPLQ